MVVADAAHCSGLWSDINFYDDRWPSMREHSGYRVAGDLSQLRQLALTKWPSGAALIVAIGDNNIRLGLTCEFEAAGFALATIVHPSAIVSVSAKVGPGSVVCAGVVINPQSEIGTAVIVNTGAIVDHHAAVADGVHICPGAAIAGNVFIGKLAFVGIGACVIQGVTIGESAIVGAGSVVIRNVEAGWTAVGNPARCIKRL